MKKIVLLAINSRWTHSNLALFYLKRVIADLPFQTNILECTINQSLEEILADIYHAEPEMIAISVYIWNVQTVKQILSESYKILPNCQIILGGPEVSYHPQKWLAEFPHLSHIICGAGEISWRETVLGKRTERIIPSQTQNFSDIPFPYEETDWQLLANKYVYYESSRGCPFRCSYCLSSRQDNQPDYKPIHVVFQELENLISHRPKIIKFVDRTFNSEPKRARKIWQFLADKNCKCHFEIHPQLLTEEDFTILRQVPASHFQFEIGIQTLNKKTLQAIHRKQDWQKCKANILRLREVTQIHLHVDLILGLPFETSKTFQESFNEVYLLRAEAFQLGFLKVLAGTEMQEKEEEYELTYLSSPPYQVLSTKWMSYSELLYWQDIEKLLNLFYNSGRFEITSKELEQLYASPYELYDNLRSFWKQHDYSFQQKNWDTIIEQLIHFMQENWISKVSFFRDCLRWDWCKQASSHYYSPCLQKTSFQQLKKDWFPALKETVPLKQLKKAIFLEIETDNFAEKYAKSYKQIVWLGEKENRFWLGRFT